MWTCCAVKHMWMAAGRCSAFRCQPFCVMMSLIAYLRGVGSTEFGVCQRQLSRCLAALPPHAGSVRRIGACDWLYAITAAQTLHAHMQQQVPVVGVTACCFTNGKRRRSHMLMPGLAPLKATLHMSGLPTTSSSGMALTAASNAFAACTFGGVKSHKYT